MAAATQSGQTMYVEAGCPIMRIRVSNMTSGQIETLSYNFTSMPAALPYAVEMNIANAGAGQQTLQMECDYTAGSANAKTVPARFYVQFGGDITGCIADVYLYFTGSGMAAQTSP